MLNWVINTLQRLKNGVQIELPVSLDRYREGFVQGLQKKSWFEHAPHTNFSEICHTNFGQNK